ncbi:MAG: sensor histidine kinase [Aggregatilineales bacterium]
MANIAPDDIDRAMRTLSRMHDAAPANVAAKIAEVMNLLLRLETENSELREQLTAMRQASQRASVPAAPSLFDEPPLYEDDTPKPAAVTDALQTGGFLRELFDTSSTEFDLFTDIDTSVFHDTPHPPSHEPTASDNYGEETSEFGITFEELLAQQAMRDVVDTSLVENSMTETERLRISNLNPSRLGEAKSLGMSSPAFPSAEDVLDHVRLLLKPPLDDIRRIAQNLQQPNADPLTIVQIGLIQTMQLDAEQSLSLLESVELLQMLATGKLKLELADFQPGDLVRGAILFMHDRARARDHTITYQIDPDLPLVRADLGRCLVILTDLIDNAIRYSPRGSSSRLTADPLGAQVLFTLADNGIGLSEEDLPYVGTPFWRALHQPLVREQPGNGLKLYLARQMLALQGGELIFSGEPNVGSSFSFTLNAVTKR